jgi:hypothetical protein
VVVLGTLATGLLAYVLRRVLRRVVFAVAGLATLVVFVVIRAASIQHVDKFLQLGGRVGINVILELSGISLVILSVLVWHRSEVTSAEARCRRIAQAAPCRAQQEPAPTRS